MRKKSAVSQKRLSFSLVVAWLSFFLLLVVFFLLPPSGYDLVPFSKLAAKTTREFSYQLPTPPLYPFPKLELSLPELTATSAAILDRHSGVFLFQKNSHQPLLPASTTKIMTALVSLEHYSLNNILLVPHINNVGQDMALAPNELITTEALLYGLLVSSANDAAQVLAENYPGGSLAFVNRMNSLAQELGLRETYFVNSSGLEGSRYSVYPQKPTSQTSAWDLTILADEALKNKVFSQIVSTKSVVVRDPLKVFSHFLSNLNQLLWNRNDVFGIKTGWTEDAGECLVTYISRDQHELIIALLGSQDRFGETEKLIDWAFTNFHWQTVNL